MPRLARLVPILALLLSACAGSRPEVYEVTEVDRPPDVTGDSLAAEAERARVTWIQPARVTPDRAPDRAYDLLQTQLDLRFDFPAQRVLGTAIHRLTPLRDSLRTFYFDAETMDFESVHLLADTEIEVPFDYDGRRITLRPVRPLRYGQTYAVRIRYSAEPGRGAGLGGLGDGGQGLYFIDPAGDDPYRPTQVWTQGQTISNRRWFPTWDSPNDRSAFEIALTVPDSLYAAANGERVRSTALPDGLRRDVFRLDSTHASYLTAVAVGPFAVVRDSVRSTSGRMVPLEYLVEPEFVDRVPAIFGETPRMLEVFERAIGVPYPWADYKQAAVRDFTAGGMENTTLTLLTERVLTDERAALDYDSRDLLAHELVHHWFGNLVTTEDWGNLALNESFASYFEEVYREATQGPESAAAHAIADREDYLGQAQRLRRPIVWFGFESDAEMFDRHTYQKGGQVLRHLRYVLGDTLFWRGIHRYVRQHAYGTVELADLRQAMEEVSGRGLRRFFSQWWENPGHPVLNVEGAYFAGSRVYTLQVTQTQDRAQSPIFHFPVNVELNFPDGTRELRRVEVTSADTTFRFPATAKPAWVRFNEGEHLLADITLDMPLGDLAAQAARDDEMASRYAAVLALRRLDAAPTVRTALVAAASDAHPMVRAAAVSGLARYLDAPDVVAQLRASATRDADPLTRQAALAVLASVEDPNAVEPAFRAALQDSSYQTAASAVTHYARLYPAQAEEAFRPLLGLTSRNGVVERALVQAIDTLALGGASTDYLVARAGSLNPDPVRVAAIGALARAARRSEAQRPRVQAVLLPLLRDPRRDVRLAAASTLGAFDDPAVLAALQERLEAEADEEVKAAIGRSIERTGEERTVIGGTR